MNTDTRKKGCPNPNCIMHQRKLLQKADDYFCPKCGTPLVFVCAKCFSELPGDGPKQRLCSLCAEEAGGKYSEALGKVRDGAGKALHYAAGFGATLAAGLADRLMAEGRNKIVSAGTQIVEKAVENVVNSLKNR